MRPKHPAAKALVQFLESRNEEQAEFYLALRDHMSMIRRLTGKPITPEQEALFYEEYVRQHGEPLK